jgi:cbb3-type cytochrome oxidase subunit 3
MLACVAIFIAVVGWQLMPARRQEQDEASRLPLND